MYINMYKCTKVYLCPECIFILVYANTVYMDLVHYTHCPKFVYNDDTTFIIYEHGLNIPII